MCYLCFGLSEPFAEMESVAEKRKKEDGSESG